MKNVLIAALFAGFAFIHPAQAAGQQQLPVSEDVKTRLDKQEIISLMVRIGRMPRLQQDRKMDLISNDPSASKTPRSDFTFCMGLAYLGDSRAQECVGSSYEKGSGIVEDLIEAYTWYAVALENHPGEDAATQRLQAEKERVLTKLHSSYPSPTDEELEDMVQAQKDRISQYQSEAKKAQN